MKNINKILAVSIIAMMAVPAAHAKIVAESMLSGEDAGYYGTGNGQRTVKQEIDSKQDTLVPGTNIAGGGSVSITKDNGVITITGAATDISGKQDKLNSTGDGANVVAGTDTGHVVTSITASGGTVTVNKAGGVITSTDIASNANIAKTQLASGVQTLLDLADTAVQPGNLATVATSGEYSDLSNKPDLAAVATTGDYEDLDNTPELAAVATTGDYEDLDNTPELATVATTGDYEDLSNTPVLATVATSGDYSDLSNTPDFGDMAFENPSDYATAEQGAKADSAIQPEDLADVATTGDYTSLANTPNLGTMAFEDSNDYVPVSRTINSKGLSDNITLDGSDVKVKTGYAKQTGNVAAGDTIDTAIGKLETKADSAVKSVTTGDAQAGVGSIKVDGNAVTVYGLGTAAGSTVETTGVSSNTTTLPTTAQVKTYVDTAVNGLNSNNTYEVTAHKSNASAATTDLADNDKKDTYYPTLAGAKAIADAEIATLDATKSQTAGADGLALSISEVDGKITSISGSIAANTYDAHGAAAAVENKLDDGASGYDINAKSLQIQGQDVKSFKAGTNVSFGAADANGVIPINSTYSYSLPIASDTQLGGVKEGSTVDIDANGVINVVDATSSQKGAALLAADVQNTTAVNTTAENVSNKVNTMPSGWNKYTYGGTEETTGQNLYPSVYATQEMISNNLTKKVNMEETTQANSLMVRNTGGVAVKGTSNDISVTTSNGTTNVTVTHATAADSATSATSATNATNATNDGSGNNIVNTYATKSSIEGLDWGTTQETSGSISGNVVTSVTQTDGQIALTKGNVLDTVSVTGSGNAVTSISENNDGKTINVVMGAMIPVPTQTTTTGTLVLTATSDGDGGYVYTWEDLGR